MEEKHYIDFLENELAPDRKKEVLDYLKAHPEEAGEWFEMRRIFERDRLNGFIEDKEQALDRFHGRIAAREAGRKMDFYRKMRFSAYRVAAVAVLLVAISFIIHQYTLSPACDNFIVASVDKGKDIKKLILPDGSVVFLNAGSTIRYPEAFPDNCREVYLEGEAFFEVRRNILKPFKVHSADFWVEVLGTTFNVSSYADDRLSETTLVSGSVRLLSDNGTPMVVLCPGQKASFDKVTGNLYVEEVNTSLDTSWKEGIIAFENATIKEICDRLTKEYDVNIFIANIDPNQLFTGECKKTEEINGVLEMLKYTARINYETQGKNIYLHR